VDSIINRIDTESYHIIIVDNCSPDNSGEQLISKYAGNRHIVVICNESNLGFARGNNVGFRYAKNMGCKFIVVLNNDTLLLQDNFYKVIKDEYERSKFAVLGPLIETPYNKLTDNPGRNTVMSKKELHHFIFLVRIRLLFNYLRIEPVYDRLLSLVQNRSARQGKNTCYKTRCENVQLHGCCLVFSPQYISRFNGLNENTFLYMEEDILYAEMMIAKMKTVYTPDLRIFHKGGGSTNTVLRNNVLKRRFNYKCHLQSAQVLKRITTG
jgi:GT2 family glycosyltransferase